MAEHIVSAFDADLESLRRTIAEMGGIAEKMLTDATMALVRRDVALADQVVGADKRIDQLQHGVEERAILTLVRRTPVAVDLREVVSAIRVAGDIERIGDLAKNIAKRVAAIGGQYEPKKAVVGLQHMSDLAQRQLKDVLDAYLQNDVEAAMDVWRRDGEIDAMHNSLFRELLTYMMEDPRNITFCTHMLFCAKNIERIGDHTTNIAETIYYRISGEVMAEERPKDDRTSFAVVPGLSA